VKRFIGIGPSVADNAPACRDRQGKAKETAMSGKMRMAGRGLAIGLAAAISAAALPAAAQSQQGRQCWTGNMPQFTKTVGDHSGSKPTSSQNPYAQQAMHATAGCTGTGTGGTKTSSATYDRKAAALARIKAEQRAIEARRRAGIQAFLRNRQAAKMPQIYVPNANPQGPTTKLPMLVQKSMYQNRTRIGANGQAPSRVPSHFKGKFK
jgi:hypothetical protein